jgi:uncharacterized membrane protein
MQELKLSDIYDLYYVPLWRAPWFIATTSVLLFCVIAVIVYLFLKRKQKLVVLTSQQQALAQLYHLKKNELESPKFFYIQLTSILKQFFGSRYNLPLVGTTDTEMLKVLKESSTVPEFVIEAMEKLLHGVALIKFANQKVAADHIKQAAIMSIDIVKKIPEIIEQKK